jgi:hypothetical protein
MSRIFIHQDKTGKVLSVVSTDSLPEGADHPFHLSDPEHTATELPADHPAHEGSLLDVIETGAAPGGDQARPATSKKREKKP